ncbi:MAG TPA: hypothetical protein ENO05_11170, partial [Bacteroides sp.]|nr:hypothetical protein [Bacteroides sp.]
MKLDNFSERHIGPRQEEIGQMLEKIGVGSMKELIEKALPPEILEEKPLDLPDGMDEHAYLEY